MDKVKGLAKGGWHPSGDPTLHRDSWKSDLKGLATGKKKDPYESARNHQSAPLNALKDPDSFGPPPRHSSAYGSTPASPSSPRRPQQGLGAPVPAPRRRDEEEERQTAEEEKATSPPVPYRTDTSGLRTDNLPKPPVRRVDGAGVPPPPARNTRQTSPILPSRQQAPPPPPPQPPNRSRPMPALPPRMNEHPDEYTPPPPPSYGEATQPGQRPDPAALNTGALSRLSRAGISVPGFDIGSTSSTSTAPSPPTAASGHGGQLSELQQRFRNMRTGHESSTQQSPPVFNDSAAAATAQKKAPPLPPPKKAELSGSGSRPSTSDDMTAPPPLPLASKPRPT